MRLLICTQTIDMEDPVLGFFHGWIEELSKQYEKITVICLKEGVHSLPKNVVILSLGKEKGTSRMTRVFLFFRYIISNRRNYDAVLVHMNQEYVLLGGWFWKLVGKRIYLWRNHYSGSIFTDIASLFCTKLFCTSKFSYTAKYTKTVSMPVGINTEKFKEQGMSRTPRSVLFLGRIAPSKRADIFLEAIAMLHKEKIIFTASIYGDAVAKDSTYYNSLKNFVVQNNLGSTVSFHHAIANEQTPAIYGTHEIFVNLSPSGMFDKTIFEALACGCIVVAASGDWKVTAYLEGIFDGSAKDLARALKYLLIQSPEERNKVRGRSLAIEPQSLHALGKRLSQEIQ